MVKRRERVGRLAGRPRAAAAGMRRRRRQGLYGGTRRRKRRRGDRVRSRGPQELGSRLPDALRGNVLPGQRRHGRVLHADRHAGRLRVAVHASRQEIRQAVRATRHAHAVPRGHGHGRRRRETLRRRARESGRAGERVCRLGRGRRPVRAEVSQAAEHEQARRARPPHRLPAAVSADRNASRMQRSHASRDRQAAGGPAAHRGRPAGGVADRQLRVSGARGERSADDHQRLEAWGRLSSQSGQGRRLASCVRRQGEGLDRRAGPGEDDHPRHPPELRQGAR